MTIWGGRTTAGSPASPYRHAWQPDRHPRSSAIPILGTDRAAMRVCNRLDDGKPETSPAIRCRRSAREWVERPVDQVGREPRTGVLHGEAHVGTQESGAKSDH